MGKGVNTKFFAQQDVILVVGNKPALRSHLRDVLVPGYNVVEAADGAKGFKLVQNLLPHLVICDINIPAVDGTGLCKALKRDNETAVIPLILLFAEGMEESIVKGFESGADDCIVRPFNVNILKARIKSLIDNRRQLLDKIRLWDMLQPEQPEVDSDDWKFIEQLHGVIEANLSNPLFTVEELSDKLCMSRASMYRKIHSLTSQSPQLFIRSYRLKRAAQLLEHNHGNITEVCFSVGFTSTAYFTKCFKKKFRQCPKTFARALNGSRN